MRTCLGHLRRAMTYIDVDVYIRMMKILIQYGADPNMAITHRQLGISCIGFTPLEWLCINYGLNGEYEYMLIDDDPDEDLTDEFIQQHENNFKTRRIRNV